MFSTLRLALAVAGALAAFAGEAFAQNAACDRMRADLAALDGAIARSGQQGGAETLRRQRSEMERTRAYARSIGCQRQRVLFFDTTPPQCGPLIAQIDEMEANLAALESQADRYGGGPIVAQRAALSATFDTQCRGLPPAAIPGQSGGVVERLFGRGAEEPVVTEELPPVAGSGFADGAYKTLCVRKCDGYYFPISFNANRTRFEADSALCQASCPNADVELFVHPAGQQVEAAQSLTGQPYSAMPNAFRYRRAFDSACGCRKPGQSWVETLADADRLNPPQPGDIVVTEQKSLEMSRPPEPTKAAAPGLKPPAKPAPAKPAPGAAPTNATKPQAAATPGDPPRVRTGEAAATGPALR